MLSNIFRNEKPKSLRAMCYYLGSPKMLFCMLNKCIFTMKFNNSLISELFCWELLGVFSNSKMWIWYVKVCDCNMLNFHHTMTVYMHNNANVKKYNMVDHIIAICSQYCQLCKLNNMFNILWRKMRSLK